MSTSHRKAENALSEEEFDHRLSCSENRHNTWCN